MSGRLNLGRSEDGVWRATVRVEIRAGLFDLAKAAGYAIEFDTCDHATLKPASKALAAFTREDVLDALRTAYHEFGECGFGDAAGEHLGAVRWRDNEPATDITKADCIRRVTQLFPEFAATPTQPGDQS